MKFEIVIKHNEANKVKVIEIIDNIKKMAIKRELDFEVEHSDSDTIFIIPNVTFAKGELYKGKSEEFTKDYLKTYATADGIIVDFGKVETLG
ncbi:hypothetical protein [Aliarcobacter cryaerophilus]|uniref:hypothetical protein n=1 Tax=Aliarcobacter cryaerophilus TaxID=28198 RepID=UPI003DA4F7A4